MYTAIDARVEERLDGDAEYRGTVMENILWDC
jgi:hypothetical protein